MTVAELEERMGIGEFNRWARFEIIEPFPAFRLELLGGTLGSLLANIHRGKNSTAYEPLDFMPFIEKQTRHWEMEKKRTEAGMPEPDNRRDAELQLLVLKFGGSVRGK